MLCVHHAALIGRFNINWTSNISWTHAAWIISFNGNDIYWAALIGCVDACSINWTTAAWITALSSSVIFIIFIIVNIIHLSTKFHSHHSKTSTANNKLQLLTSNINSTTLSLLLSLCSLPAWASWPLITSLSSQPPLHYSPQNLNTTQNHHSTSTVIILCHHFKSVLKPNFLRQIQATLSKPYYRFELRHQK